MELLPKQNAVANLIDGQVTDETERVAVCIKGVVNGFPVTLEAFMVGWPWSVTYCIETNVVDKEDVNPADHAIINLVPRMGRGLLFGFFSRIFLFESKGASVGDKKLESSLIISFNNREPAMRFLRYPQVGDLLINLERYCKLREMIVRTDQGILFTQSNNFKTMDLDTFQATFKYLGELAQVIADAF